MGKKRASESKSTAKKSKSAAGESRKKQTVEIRLPDELYDKVVKLEKAKLTSILKSVLGKEARVAMKKVAIKEKIKYVKISPTGVQRRDFIGPKRLEKKCT